MKRLIFAVISVFVFSTPAFSYDFQLSPAEDTFTDSLYINEAMGDESGTHYQRLWAGPVINMQAAEETIAGVGTGIYIPGRDGTEFTHSYLKFDLSSINNTISEAKLWLYRTADDWGFPKNADTYPPGTYDDNTTYEYDHDCSGAITASIATTAVTGDVNTKFLTELKVGGIIRKTGGGTILGTIASIPDDSNLTLNANATENHAGAFASHYIKYNDPDSGTITVYYETNNGWSEATLKWKNEASGPNFSDNIAGVTTQIGPVGGWSFPNNKGWVSWDVSEFAKLAQAKSDKILSLVLANDNTTPPIETFHIFFSSESEPGTEALRPYLGVNLVPLAVTGTTYNHSTRRISITFNQTVDLSTFTAATLGNLSIQDGVTTVDLDGADEIITKENSTTMVATLSAADGTALDAIADNTLRLVVDASCGIKNLDGLELASNTYATSSYSISNTAITGTLKDSKSSVVIANATIKLYDLSGDLKAQTISDADGNFTLYANVADGNYNLVVSKFPLFKEKTEAITIAGNAASAGSILIDPYGVVYDAVTGNPIAGATVTLYTASGDIYTGCPEPNPQSSRGDGNYNFNVAPGTYYLGAVKDGYANYSGATFVVTTDIVEWNIPMTPNNQASSTFLSITKQANKKVASAGDIITYNINITNLGNTFSATSLIVTDSLPPGFKYIPGSTLVDGVRAVDPAGAATQSLRWSLGSLAVQATKRISYRVGVSSEAIIGKNKNSASVSASINGTASSAGPSISTVEIREGLFSDSGLLIGKVFEDKNGNGIQDEYEPGLPGVSLILEDGTVIITDKYGRYSVPNIKKGNHVIRIDQRVLPGGPFSKVKLSEDKKAAQKKEALSKKPPEREAAINRRQLDAWRKQVLSLFKSPVQTEAEISSVPSAKEERPVVPAKIIKEAKQVNTYFYTAKDKEGKILMGMLEAVSEAHTADILHERELAVLSIEKEGAEAFAAEEDSKEQKIASARSTPRAELLNKYPKPQEKEVTPRGRYRADIPKESKFFKIYGSETAKVNFAVKLLSQEEAKKEEKRDAAPDQFMLVGLADATVGYLEGRDNIANLESSVNDPYQNGAYADGKIKLYLKGLVKGEYLLTAALDTEKEKSRHLFDYVNPEKYYPVYADQSTYFNETEARGRFYARIDKGDSYGLWGNYNTQEFTKTEFSRYNRTLSGAKSHIKLDDWIKPGGNGLASDSQSHKEESKMPLKNTTLDIFYALSEQEQISETFSAKGISGPFWLGKTPLLEYSESIRIETRDKDRSDIILHTKPLTREVDYEVDYDSGRLFFKEAISTFDENDDPNYIVVDYEYVPLSGASKYYLTGSRLETKLFDDTVTFGGQFIAENHATNNPRLYGFDAVFSPDQSSRFSAEWGYSNHYLDTNNSTELKKDNAWKVEGSKIIGRLLLQGYYSDIGNRFRNPVNIAEKGREKYGATADYQFSDATNLVFEHWRNLSTISRTFDRQSSIDLYHKKENYFFGAGYAFAEYEDRLGLTPERDTNAMNLKVGRKLLENLVASLEQEYKDEKQDNTATALDNKTYTTTGRLDYKLSTDTGIYFKNRFIKELHKQYQNIASLGFSRTTPDGEAYIEYGFGGKTAETTMGLKREQNLNERLTLSSYTSNRVSGDKNEENVGFGTTYEISPGLFTKANFEHTYAKNSETSYYKQNSQSVAFDYLPAGAESSYGIKLERRRASQTREVNILGYAEQRLNEECRLILQSEWLMERSSDLTIHTSKKAILGFAYRPIHHDKLNLLSKYEYKDELDHSSAGSSTDYYNHILSLEANYEVSPITDIFGKYALKYFKEKDNLLRTASLIDMLTAKLTHKITEAFDVASYYRVIYDHQNCLIKQSPAFELGTVFFKRLRLGIGYNFLKYDDRHSDTEDYSGAGPYFNLSAKF